MKKIHHFFQNTIPHAWAFGESASPKTTFAWPQFDFDLEAEAEASRGEDLLLSRLHERLIIKTSQLRREH